MSERDMQQLLAVLERALGENWRDIIAFLLESNQLEDVEARLAAGDVDGAMQGIEEAAEKFALDTEAAYRQSGEAAAGWLDGEVDHALIRFDVGDAHAVEWARNNRLDTIRAITEEQRTTIRQVIADGISRGANPLETAREIRASIGLTPYQEGVVQRYRRALESGDWSDALGRELTSGHTDRTVARLARDGGRMTQEQIDTAVARYRENWHQYRAETIARTEGLRTLHEGTEEAFRQAITNGEVTADELEREWNHAGVGRHSRRGHMMLDGETKPFGEPWTNPVTGATLRYPGDGGPAEAANCRCVVGTRLVPAAARQAAA